jgi:hypothetical protein
MYLHWAIASLMSFDWIIEQIVFNDISYVIFVAQQNYEVARKTNMAQLT